MFARFDVPYQPAMAIVAPDGTVQQFLGAVEDDELNQLLAELTA